MDEQATEVPEEDGPPELPLGQKIVYSLGYFGVSILNGLFMVWVLKVYVRDWFPDPKLQYWLVPVFLVGRVLDAVSDPLVGYFSDRTRTRWGRRKPYIALGTVPLTLAFALVWFPPGDVNSITNLWWLLVISVSYFTLFSVVVNPYLAMLPDIARTNDDRVATSSAARS